jgi:hypothetical protein
MSTMTGAGQPRRPPVPFSVSPGSPAKKTKSRPANDSGVDLLDEGGLVAGCTVICPAASSSSSRVMSQAASVDSASASLSSLPASEEAPTTAMR